MHPNVVLLILAGCTPVEINPWRGRTPRRIGAMTQDGRVLGRRAERVDGGVHLYSWSSWTARSSSYYQPVDWEHPDAQWDQIPPELLIAFTEGR